MKNKAPIEYLTPKQVAEEYSKLFPSYNSVMRAIHEGWLRHIQIGKRYVTTRDYIEESIANNTHGGYEPSSKIGKLHFI